MIVKYGNFYITWYNLKTLEFGVSDKERAMWFDSEKQANDIMSELGLQNYTVER